MTGQTIAVDDGLSCKQGRVIAGTLTICRSKAAMGKIRLTLAISDYEHVRDLTSGRVTVEGIDLTCLNLPVEEIFFRFMAFREWDVSEMSLAKYCALRAAGDDSLTAIPVFPSRMFRHSAIYVRQNGKIRVPGDLVGARVGVPEWAQTAVVYARAVLMHEYGVSLSDVKWFQSGVDQPGRREQAPISPPAGVSITPISERSLDEMLLSGEIDAAITAHPPRSFERSRGEVTRLFKDVEAVERAYFDRTRIFPIMHIVAVRRSAFDANPWILRNLLTAFEIARERALARLRETTVSRTPIPWSAARVTDAENVFGDQFWSYGIEPNRPTLAPFLQYAHEQGVCLRRLGLDELIPRELHETFRI